MTTIVAQKYYPPKEQGWSGRFKAADGNYYGCKEDMAASIPIGTPIDVEITIKEKDGKTYRDIKRVVGAAPAQAKPTTQTNGTRYGSTDDATAERIFVCGALNAMIPKMFERDGGVVASKLVDTVHMLRKTWSDTFGAKASE